MKNLTNAQLDILTEAFMERVAQEVQKRKDTPEYEKALKNAKKKADYDTIIKLSEKNEKLNQKIDKLKEQKDQLKEEYKKLKDNYWASIPSVSKLDKEMEEEALLEVAKDIPTKKQVQSQIVLMSIKKSDDILEDLAVKFKLQEDDEEVD